MRLAHEAVAAALLVALAAACSGVDTKSDFAPPFDSDATLSSEDSTSTSTPLTVADDTMSASEDSTSTSTSLTVPDGPLPATVGSSTIHVRSDAVIAPIDDRVLGSNVAVWILPDVIADQRIHEMIAGLGTTLLRFPGGSWSNDYQWADCEVINDSCPVPWASRASDLAGLMSETGLPGLWTVAFNRPAEETAAAVAFFNGDIDDERAIGVDRDGRDWRTVGYWARRRADGGHPDPVRIQYWEIGNEIYGAIAGAGSQCAPWGWENTWTCDPTDYVFGDADHDGYLRFREAILTVDPSVDVGAIGIGARGEWNDWDDTVIAATAGAVDFYSVHHYGSNGDTPPEELIRAPRREWPLITDEFRAVLEEHGIGVDVPMAVTEHNMIAFIDGDEEQLMSSAANAFYLADTIGQLITNGVSIANQWNLVNGAAENGSNYALIDPDRMAPLPAYYAMAMWARAGEDLVGVDTGDDLGSLSVYGARDGGGALRLLVLNPTDQAVGTSVVVDPKTGPTVVTEDVLVADSLEAQHVTFNGSEHPSVDLTDPPPVAVEVEGGAFDHQFPAFSITLLRWSLG